MLPFLMRKKSLMIKKRVLLDQIAGGWALLRAGIGFQSKKAVGVKVARAKPNPPRGKGGVMALAKHRGVSGRAVHKALDERRISPPDPKNGWFSFARAMREWDKNTHEYVSAVSPGGPVSNTADAPAKARRNGHKGQNGQSGRNGYSDHLSDSARYTSARATNEENKAALSSLEVEKSAASLVLVADMKKAAFEMARRTRDRILALPDRLSARLAAISDATEVHDLLSDELESALRLLGEGRA